MNSNNILIDTEYLRSWLDSQNETNAQLAYKIGRGATYFTDILRKGYMPDRVFDLFIKTFDLDAEQFKQKPKPVAPPPAAKERYSAEPIIEGYELTLQVRPSRVRVGIAYKGTEICYSWANIRGNTESDLLQAISYASHQNFKFAQIKYFGCSQII